MKLTTLQNNPALLGLAEQFTDIVYSTATGGKQHMASCGAVRRP